MYTYLAVALVAAAISAVGTWNVQTWRFDSKEKQRIQAEAKEAFRRAEITDRAAVAHEKDKERIHTKYVQVVKEVPHEVEKLVYRNVCIAPDGVRNINDLIDTYDAGKPAAAVPEAGKASERTR